MRCVLCGCAGDTESPFLSGLAQVVNPCTFRPAWLCGYCFEDELEQLKEQPASSPQYDNRHDEYLTRFA